MSWRRVVLLLSMSLVFAAPGVAAAQSASSAFQAPQAVSASGGQQQTSSADATARQLGARVHSSWPWYVIRASGLMAAGMLVLLVLSGVGLITGYTYRFLEPIMAWATHRAIGLAFGVSVLCHVVFLLFDHFLPFTLSQVLIPFTATYRPVTLFGLHLGTLWVALGIVSLYLVIAIILTSLFWIDKKPYTWKLTHLLAYMVVAFIFVHALYLGTDLAHGIWRLLWTVAGIAVAISIAYRLWRARTLR